MNCDETRKCTLDTFAYIYYDMSENLCVIETFCDKNYVGSVFSKISVDGAYRF